MKPNSKLRKIWWQFKMDPFVAPLLIGWGIVFMMSPVAPPSRILYLTVFWGLFCATLEYLTFRGYTPSERPLTPNFHAIRDWEGYWRIFQRKPSQTTTDCRSLLKKLLEDQQRLPEALTPGFYRTITHSTILNRLKAMEHITILSVRPAYIAPLDDTISHVTGHRCRRCSVTSCPFPKRHMPRQFFDVRFIVEEQQFI